MSAPPSIARAFLRLARWLLAPWRGGAIVLVGMPGAGKTTIGAALARALGFEFRDLDVRAEQVAGISLGELPTWWRDHGAAARRELMRAVFKEIPRRRAVVATGARGPCNVLRALRLLSAGRCCWLRANSRELAARLTYLRDGAPGTLRFGAAFQLSGDPVAALEARIAVEGFWYESIADLAVDTSGQPIDAIVETLCKTYSQRGN